MHKYETVSEMRAASTVARQEGRSIGLVATNGALHAGHAALIAAAKSHAQHVVVSVFRNPLAFGPSENFAGYPRSPDADLKLCEDLKVDAVFLPGTEEFYPKGYSTYVIEEAVSKPLCGVSRPSHFRGMATGTVKLLNIVRPDFLIMGQRDAQQAAVMRKVINDLSLGTEVLLAPTVRDTDGLAVTFRSRDLTSGQRQEAAAIPAALQRAREMVAQGVRSPDRIIAEATHLFGERRRIRVIYVSIVDPNTMEPLREVVPGRTMLAIAVWVDELRMIDNALL